jgi:hypothetical protein
MADLQTVFSHDNNVQNKFWQQKTNLQAYVHAIY